MKLIVQKLSDTEYLAFAPDDPHRSVVGPHQSAAIAAYVEMTGMVEVIAVDHSSPAVPGASRPNPSPGMMTSGFIAPAVEMPANPIVEEQHPDATPVPVAWPIAEKALYAGKRISPVLPEGHVRWCLTQGDHMPHWSRHDLDAEGNVGPAIPWPGNMQPVAVAKWMSGKWTILE